MTSTLPGAVAQNPRFLDIGIDEDTSLVFKGHTEARVIGSGAVYIVDGRNITYSNTAEDSEQMLSAFGATVHVLSQGDRFNLMSRQPISGPHGKVEQELAAAQ